MALLGVQRAATLPSLLCNVLEVHDRCRSQVHGFWQCPLKGTESCQLRERLGCSTRSNAASPSHNGALWKQKPGEKGRPNWPRAVDCAATSATRSPASAKANESRDVGTDEASQASGGRVETVHIGLTPLTKETFAPYGQVCGPSPDNVEFGESPEDAYLELEGGVPRFYILRLKGKKLEFDQITHHARVTQCLGSADGRPWYMGVAPASLLSNVPGEDGRLPWAPPAVSDVRVFKIEGSAFIKLNKGTWHAGPLFETPQMDFYNLEHTDTNVTDHNTHIFSKNDGVEFVIGTD